MDPLDDEEVLPDENFDNETVIDPEEDINVSCYEDPAPVSTYDDDYDYVPDEHHTISEEHPMIPHIPERSQKNLSVISEEPECSSRPDSGVNEAPPAVADTSNRGDTTLKSQFEVSSNLCASFGARRLDDITNRSRLNTSAKPSFSDNSIGTVANPLDMFKQDEEDLENPVRQMPEDDPRFDQRDLLNKAKQNDWELSPKEVSVYKMSGKQLGLENTQGSSASAHVETPKRNSSVSGSISRRTRPLMFNGSPEYQAPPPESAAASTNLSPLAQPNFDEELEHPPLAVDSTQRSLLSPPQTQQPTGGPRKDHINRNAHLRNVYSSNNQSPPQASTPKQKSSNGRAPPLFEANVSEIMPVSNESQLERRDKMVADYHRQPTGTNQTGISSRPSAAADLDDSQPSVLVNASLVEKASGGAASTEELIRRLDEIRRGIRHRSQSTQLQPMDFTRRCSPRAATMPSSSRSGHPAGTDSIRDGHSPSSRQFQQTASSASKLPRDGGGGAASITTRKESLDTMSAVSRTATLSSSSTTGANCVPPSGDRLSVSARASSRQLAPPAPSEPVESSRQSASLAPSTVSIDVPPSRPVSAMSLYITQRFHAFGFIEIDGMVQRNFKIENNRDHEVRFLLDLSVPVRAPTGTGGSKKAAAASVVKKNHPLDGFMLNCSGMQSITLTLAPRASLDVPLYFCPRTAARYSKSMYISVTHAKEVYKVLLSGYGGRCALSVLETPDIRLSRGGYYVWNLRREQTLRFNMKNDGLRPAYCTVSLNIHENGKATSEAVRHVVVPSPQVVINRGKTETFAVNIPDLEGLLSRIGRGELDGRETRNSMVSVNSAATDRSSRDHGLVITITWGEETQRRRAKEAAMAAPVLSEQLVVDSGAGRLSYGSPFLHEDPQWKLPAGCPLEPWDMQMFHTNRETMEIFVTYKEKPTQPMYDLCADRTLVPETNRTTIDMSTFDATIVPDVTQMPM